MNGIFLPKSKEEEKNDGKSFTKDRFQTEKWECTAVVNTLLFQRINVVDELYSFIS